MQADTPYWVKLLLAWEKRGGAGLTLPFLAGARTIADAAPDPSPEDAKKLLEDIFAIGIAGRILGINWSGSTRAYGIILHHTNPVDGIFLATPAKIFAIELACEEFGSDPEEIIHGMTELYSEQIENKTYSITSGKWRAFDATDEEFIRNAMAL